jgi:hypothetical protein
MIINHFELKEIKKLKNLTILWDEVNKQLVFEREKFWFVLHKNELFPTQRALTRVEQRGFYRKKK